MKQYPKLQVFCPVDPAELETTPNGIICRKCQRDLVDVSSPSGAKNLTRGVCGVMRVFTGSVVGSTIALSSCAPDTQTTEARQQTDIASRADRELSHRSEVPRPGIYYHPGGETFDVDSYPVAERTDRPGIVVSPYSQSEVDVIGITAGTLVRDPESKMDDKKFFRVPSASGTP